MKMIALSLGLLSLGVALAFLMVINLLTPSFTLSFLAYAASLTGLALGGAATVQHSSIRGRGRD